MATNSELEVLYPWMNKEFFYKILSKECPENSVEIKNVVLKAALPKGENYTSQMIRAKIEYSLDQTENKEISFIIKAALLNNDYDEEMLKDLSLFGKEITAFQSIIPRVYELLHGIGDETKLASRCFDASVQQSYIVFEDMTAKHYANIDKKLGLGLEHFKIVFTKLAKWHAATAVLETMDNSLMDGYRTHFAQEPNSIFKDFTNNTFTLTSKLAKLWPGFEQISKKLENSSPEKFYQKVLDSVILNSDEFNVLTHGDLWVNNIMFTQNENGEPTDCILVDFQIGYWGSPVLDILNNYFSSFRADLCETDLDTLVEHYFEILKSTLNALNYSKRIPTLADIKTQVLKRGIYGSPSAIFTAAARNLEAAEVTGLSLFMGVTEEAHEYRLKIVSKPQCKKAIEFLLNYSDRMGYYD